MKCLLCDARKGKRSCPAKNALICSQCCGEKRILEIDCPESCEFLQAGRAHEIHAQRMRHLIVSDPVKMEKRKHVLTDLEDAFALLEYHIAEERRSDRDLSDGILAEALDLILATLRTEEKGVIYERESTDLRVDGVRRRLRDRLESLFNPRERTQRRLRRGEAMECLEVIREMVSSHMDAGSSALSYVDFLARIMPAGERAGDSSPGIIIPGR